MLTFAGVRPRDVACVALGWQPSRFIRPDALRDSIGRALPQEFDGLKFDSRSIPHHVAHAASAFYQSGFDRAAILVVDGEVSANRRRLVSGMAEA